MDFDTVKRFLRKNVFSQSALVVWSFNSVFLFNSVVDIKLPHWHLLKYHRYRFLITAHFQILVFQDTVYIQTHYNIEDFIHFNDYQQEEHGELYHFVLNPIFRHYTKHFLKEILRLAHKSSLFYPVYPQYAEGKVRMELFLFYVLNIITFAHLILFASMTDGKKEFSW